MTNNPQYMTDTKFTNTAQKLNAAMRRLREHQDESRMFAVPEEFDPSPTNALGFRAHAIKKFYSNLPTEMLTGYLQGLGYVRKQLITARDVLNTDGKKKYEAYIKNSVETLPARFYGLRPYYLGILTGLMAIPFRRSAEKDRREISDSLCLIANCIEKYRYKGANEQYRDYAQTIITGIDTEQLPPMIAGLIIQELTSLVSVACATNIMSYTKSGITHEELWRYHNPNEYNEVYQDGNIPKGASPLEALDIYPPHEGIARQSLWWGLDDEVDCFITSLTGGLLINNLKQISMDTLR
ncbi:hypothetical protein [Citrobacter pasteurii]|uniref:Uncharacterized protein n=2 Tax=Enterobacteriaceae TaxID=543 RepID=A0ABX8KC68_9ENTR|nr:hypothetical protein [Citrobacter pasteurii]QXA46476.1 hypothetical protein I6L54_08910 [Citrobacter pasteurii]CEJ64543.1 hypothetical protein [Citrobacter pasteurii]